MSVRRRHKKAANGEGSVKFYPSMNRIVGKWYHNGKPIKKYGKVGVGRDPKSMEFKAEASVVWKMLEPYLNKDCDGDLTQTVKGVIDAYIARPNIAPATRYRYKKVVYQTRRDDKGNKIVTLRPYMLRICAKRVVEVKPSDVQATLDGIVSVRGAKMDRTRELVCKLLRGVFKAPINDRLITVNPAKAVETPQYRREERTRIFTPTEQAFLRQANTELGGANEALLLLQLSMPLRPCEAYALRRCDVNLSARKAKIENDLIATEETNHKPVLGPCKTPESRRTIFLYDEVAAALSRQLQVQMAAGRTTPESFIFTSPDGQAIRHSNLARGWWKPLLKKAAELAEKAARDSGDLDYRFPKDAGPYSLRHTAIFNLKRAGVPLDIAKLLAGHTKLATTLEIYNQLTDQDGADAAQAVGDWLFGSRASAIPAR